MINRVLQLIVLCVATLLLSPISGPVVGQQTATYNLEEGDQFQTRVKRTYRTLPPPCCRDTKTSARINTASGYLSTYKKVIKQGKSAVDPLLNKGSRYGDQNSWQPNSVDQFLIQHSSSMKEIREDLLSSLYRMMVLYSTFTEAIQFSSTVEEVKQDGSLRLSLSIDGYRFRWKRSDPFEDVEFSTGKTPSNPVGKALSKPFDTLRNKPYQVTLARKGNVLVGSDFVRRIQYAAKQIPEGYSLRQALLYTFIQERILTPRYVRDLIYQSWAKQYDGTVDENTEISDVVLIPPSLQENPEHLPRLSFQRHQNKSDHISFEGRQSADPKRVNDLRRVRYHQEQYYDAQITSANRMLNRITEKRKNLLYPGGAKDKQLRKQYRNVMQKRKGLNQKRKRLMKKGAIGGTQLLRNHHGKMQFDPENGLLKQLEYRARTIYLQTSACHRRKENEQMDPIIKGLFNMYGKEGGETTYRFYKNPLGEQFILSIDRRMDPDHARSTN